MVLASEENMRTHFYLSVFIISLFIARLYSVEYTKSDYIKSFAYYLKTRPDLTLEQRKNCLEKIIVKYSESDIDLDITLSELGVVNEEILKTKRAGKSTSDSDFRNTETSQFQTPAPVQNRNETTMTMPSGAGKNIQSLPPTVPSESSMNINRKKYNIGIMEFTRDNHSNSIIANQANSEITAMFVQLGYFNIVERSRLRAIFNQQRFSLSGLVELQHM